MIYIAQYNTIMQSLGLTTREGVKRFQGELVKDHDGRREIFRIHAGSSGDGDLVLYLKRVWRAKKKDGLSSLLRRGKVWSCCRQEWENYRTLQNAGVGTAELVAFGEECLPLWEKFSFIVTRAADGQQTVEDFLRDCRDRALRRKVIDALAREVRRMHDAGLATPDLFTRHVFVNTSGEEPRFCFIDLARLDRFRSIPDRVRARDLAALNVTAPLHFVSKAERLRFLRVYSERKDKALLEVVRQRVNHLLKRKKFQGFLGGSDPKVNWIHGCFSFIITGSYLSAWLELV
jgi:tRNA A-37 threonylcarbamoyl transferase component Bud32